MHARRTFAAASMLLASVMLTACSGPIAGSETEGAVCSAWKDALPTRSRSDTQQTVDEIEVGYDAFLAACPHLELPF